jgi:hypothetical protein
MNSRRRMSLPSGRMRNTSTTERRVLISLSADVRVGSFLSRRVNVANRRTSVLAGKPTCGATPAPIREMESAGCRSVCNLYSVTKGQAAIIAAADIKTSGLMPDFRFGSKTPP